MGHGKKQFTEALQAKNVIILEDNDNPGHSFAQRAAKEIYSKALSVKVIDLTKEWTSLKPHGDITDTLSLENSPNDLQFKLSALVGLSPEFDPSEVTVKELNDDISLEFISAATLQNKELPELVYFVSGMLSQGLALLASPPKYGKSWLVLDLCLSIAEGSTFLGHETQKSSCLYLALEDTQRRLKDRMNKVLQGKRAPDNFFFSTSSKTIDDGLTEQLEQFLVQKPDTKLIVIDTLQKVRGVSNSKDVYGRDYQDMSILKTFADKHNICVLLVHHLRKGKSEGDPFDRISGTNGIMGAADTAFVLEREKRTDEQTTMSITSRDLGEIAYSISFNKDTYKWENGGNAEWLRKERERLDYYENPVVITIKKLLEQSPENRWDGTAKQLLEAGETLYSGGYIATDAQNLGYKLRKLEEPLLRYDNIIYSTGKKNGCTNNHFYYKPLLDRGFEIVEQEELPFSI